MIRYLFFFAFDMLFADSFRITESLAEHMGMARGGICKNIKKLTEAGHRFYESIY